VLKHIRSNAELVILILVTFLVVFMIANSGFVSASSQSQNATASNETQIKYAFIAKWGSKGSGPGQFNRPHDITFDSSGNVYVSDRDNNRIQKFTPNGTFIKTWGTKGSKDGQFSIPYSIAIDNSDKIYVADRENSRIQEFNTNGTFLAKYGSDGVGNGQFHRPEDVRIESRTGDIYVTDTYNNRVEKFDKNFTFITKWGSKGTADGQFKLPHAIGFDSKGNVYVDELERPGVQIFDSNGKYLGKWGTIGTSDGEFSLPQEHLWIDSKNHLYLVDGAPNPRVQIFDPNGRFLGKVGTPCLMSTGEGCKDPDGPGPLSLGDGQFSKPEHVAINSEGKMFVVDRGNHRIQVFAPVSNSTAEKSQ
jgi:NHL repeat/6-bladed beta-propeller